MNDLEYGEHKTGEVKYRQVYLWLKSMIETNKFAEDSRLPSEEELARQFGISRMTVRKAMAELVREGMIVRIRRKGTFLSENYTHQGNFFYNLNEIISFESLIREKHVRSTYRVCENRVVEASPQVIKELALPENSLAIKIYRIISVNGKPAFLEKSYFPYPKFKMFLEKDFNRPNIMSSVIEALGIELACASQILVAGLLDSGEKIDLRYDRSVEVPCMRQQNIICDVHRQPVFAFHATFPGDRFRFIVSSDRYKLDML